MLHATPETDWAAIHAMDRAIRRELRRQSAACGFKDVKICAVAAGVNMTPQAVYDVMHDAWLIGIIEEPGVALDQWLIFEDGI